MKSLATLFAAILLAACSSSQLTGQSGASINQAQAAAAVHRTASAPATSASHRDEAPAPVAPTAAPAAAGQSNPACLPPKELPRGPLGCQPPAPILPRPPVQAPRIAWCAPFPMLKSPAPIGILAQIRVCGSGFAAAEVVTLTLTTRYGTNSWTVTAGAAGTFQSALVPANCRNFPGTIVAHGSRGRQSNVLQLPGLPCRAL